ncbi:hypothetical protein [uncultured Comamonas sp.]|uniref:hypothetical protein n=1 Tax=uncultured Comamonas sp. TaxID=114710 RepID=UPI003747EC8B
MQATAIDFPWATELEKSVIHALTTSFGLDFLLFKDKDGGDVNTIHNARNGVYATSEEHERFQQKEAYDRKKSNFDKHENFIAKGREDKALQEIGILQDGYTGKIIANKKGIRHLDHVISAKEIYNDAGRVLADLDAVNLASHGSNFQSTHASINTSKSDLSVEDFLSKLPERIERAEEGLAADQKRLAFMPRDTPQQRHEAQGLEDSIRKNDEKIKALKSVDPASMRKKDQAARKEYNSQINQKYYTSSKFLGSALQEAGTAGIKMGVRQMLGLIYAELWFELRAKIPEIVDRSRKSFSLDGFLIDIKAMLESLWNRIQARFRSFLTTFKDGIFSGILASATTTVFNIFATTSKSAVKIIREMWGQLVKAFKILAFNPDNLSAIELTKAVLQILSAGVATIIGSLIYAELVPLLQFPFGNDIAAFLGALTTGLIIVGLQYVLLYSPMMQKLWSVVDNSTYVYTVREFQAINAELDRYLGELARIEFNLNAEELTQFAQELGTCNDEIERGLILREEVAKRGIKLPFEMGQSVSTRKWLGSLAK